MPHGHLSRVAEAAIHARIQASREAGEGFDLITKHVPTDRRFIQGPFQGFSAWWPAATVTVERYDIATADSVTHQLLRSCVTIPTAAGANPEAPPFEGRLLAVRVIDAVADSPCTVTYNDPASLWVDLVGSPYADPEQFPKIYQSALTAIATATTPAALTKMADFGWALYDAGRGAGINDGLTLGMALGSCLQIIV